MRASCLEHSVLSSSKVSLGSSFLKVVILLYLIEVPEIKALSFLWFSGIISKLRMIKNVINDAFSLLVSAEDHHKKHSKRFRIYPYG